MPGVFTKPCHSGRTKQEKTASENFIPRMTIAGYKGGRIKRNLNWSKSTTLKNKEKKDEQNESNLC